MEEIWCKMCWEFSKDKTSSISDNNNLVVFNIAKSNLIPRPFTNEFPVVSRYRFLLIIHFEFKAKEFASALTSLLVKKNLTRKTLLEH